MVPSLQMKAAHTPVLVSEGLHVLSPSFYQAANKKDEILLRTLARQQKEAGAQALAVNLGPGKDMAKHFPWVVSTLVNAVDLPLFLSSGILAFENVLDRYRSRIVVNAVTADPATLAESMRTAGQYDLGLVVLLVRPGFVPAAVEDRMQIAAEVIGTAIDNGLPLQQLYLDPVINCRPDPQSWEVSRGLPDIQPVLETVTLLKDMNLDIKTIAALGNGTSGLAPEKKSAVHGRMLDLFLAAGIDAIIVNCLDKNLMKKASRKNYPTYLQ